ncbi:cytochrome C [Moritella sp. 24]|uniref:cytochrome C n=1 Tax=Moritella sp. 24 TaxID=2746230 RepID=UPI001BA5E71B|nr:cytochrome C [Moritella sp. 24]QUM75285.1 cytochrome C [Moritella sp. 24]
MNKLRYLILLFLLGASTTAAAKVENYLVDEKSGLIMAPGWEVVNKQCNACHTSLIITQNKGNKEEWRETIQWMVDSQGLWDLSDTWEPVLDYLSTYYNQQEIDLTTFRRLPLAVEYQPPVAK